MVWRDFSPNNPSDTNSVLSGEDGYPLLHLALVNSQGATVATTTTGADGQFMFSSVGPGKFRARSKRPISLPASAPVAPVSPGWGANR